MVVIALTGLLSTVGAAFLGGAFANSAVHDQLDIARQNAIKDQRRQIYVDYLRATAKACELAERGGKASEEANVDVLNQQARVLLIFKHSKVKTAVDNFTNKLFPDVEAGQAPNPCDLPNYKKLRDAFIAAAQPDLEE